MTSATADACSGQEDGVPIGASDTIAGRVGISDPLSLAFLCQFRQFVACGHTPAVGIPFCHVSGGLAGSLVDSHRIVVPQFALALPGTRLVERLCIVIDEFADGRYGDPIFSNGSIFSQSEKIVQNFDLAKEMRIYFHF